MKVLNIEVKNISKSYDDLKVIIDFNMCFSSNRIHCFFGPSGCGKTTLANILTGVISADSGHVIGKNNKKISYIFQEDRLLPWATVKENILFVLDSFHNKSEAQLLADKYLSMVDLLKFKNHYPHQLSGGMKQRVSIARAFAYGGEILVMDEPFKGLHLGLKKNLMDYIIDNWNHESSFLFFITHDIDEAIYMADDIYIFNGPPLKLKRRVTIDTSREDRRNNKKLETYKKIILEDN
ncbi:MAG: ABC transporter ATP-binding protein [Clostridiales bacterium]|nr:ABC transporter ATP-binding protein [Clostridiales bacterium]